MKAKGWPYKPDRKVNIVKVMQRDLHMSKDGAICMIVHGQVTIDGHTIGMRHAVNHWTEKQLYGRMLKAGHREHRLIGSRMVEHLEQLRLERNG